MTPFLTALRNRCFEVAVLPSDHRLAALDEVGKGRIIEYYGPGLTCLSAMDRHVIANMGAELGATTSGKKLGYDDPRCNSYLRSLLHRPKDSYWGELKKQGSKNPVDQNRSPVKRLKEYFAFLSEAFVDSDYSKGCLFGNLANEMADHSPVIRERLKSNFVGWTQVIASVIREGQEAGEIASSQKPQQLAGFLISAWEGTLVRARCTKDLSPLKDFNENRCTYG